MIDEISLLQGVQRFEEQALVEIYDQFSPGIYRYAFRLLGDEDNAEECVAETFRRFLNALKQNKGPKTYIKAYLYRIAHNWITDYYRRYREIVSFDNIDRKSENFVENRIPKDIEEQQFIRNALSSLSMEQRQVIVLKFIEGWNNQQISEALEKPVGAIKSLQHRALNRLRLMLQREIANE